MDNPTVLVIGLDILLNVLSILVLLRIRRLGLVGRNKTMLLFTLSVVSGFLFVVLAPLGLGFGIVVPFILSDLFLLLALVSLERSLRRVVRR